MQTIFRTDASSNQRYTIINNKLLQDRRISRETKGLLVEILSRPDDWEVCVKEMIASGQDGKHRIYRMINEAKEFGYIIVGQNAMGGRQATQEYIVSDDPEYLQERYDKICQEIIKYKREKQSESLGTQKSGSNVLRSKNQEAKFKEPKNQETKEFKEKQELSLRSENQEAKDFLPHKNQEAKETSENQEVDGLDKKEKKQKKERKKEPKKEIKKIKKIKNIIPAHTREEKNLFDFDDSQQPGYNPNDWKRNHRLPECWDITPPVQAWLDREFPRLEVSLIRNEIEAFRDYHHSRGNSMNDWNRAFYTWMRNAKKFGNFTPKPQSWNRHQGSSNEFKPSQEAIERHEKIQWAKKMLGRV